MSNRTSWTTKDLKTAARNSYSIRQVINSLGLIPAGGNYQQIKRAILKCNIDISHFTGQGWKKNRKFEFSPRKDLGDILKKGTSFQSFKLKNRLFLAGIKKPKCEICGWAELSIDGRIPVELDHINGDSTDNRLDNLRILCPNCHSLQSTHRGMNQGRHRRTIN